MRFTTEEIARAAGGEVFGRETEVDGVSIDSRSVRPGQLFVPIVAERDGHEFIGDAVAAGATAYLTSGPIEAATAVRVTDTSDALTALGVHARSRLPDRVVGITGSVGKTSVKDLLAAVAGTTWPTAAAAGSFNNELGVPLTLANAHDDTELTVIEMGARGVGHIAHLCTVARPTVGIVTLVAGAHLEQFGSLEGVAAAKAELVESLPASGTAVLNADDARVAAMADRTDASVLTFGLGAAEVRAVSVSLGDDLRARFTIRSPWGSADVHLGAAGVQQVPNALAAAAAALVLGADVADVASGLAAARLSARRMHLTTTSTGLKILDDCYNANPTSMMAALDALAAIPVGDGGRRVAVVGTMAELGGDATEAHRSIAAAAYERGLHVLSVAEPRYGVEGADAADSAQTAVERLHELGVGAGDAVLVKASRAAGLESVVTLLTER